MFLKNQTGLFIPEFRACVKQAWASCERSERKMRGKRVFPTAFFFAHSLPLHPSLSFYPLCSVSISSLPRMFLIIHTCFFIKNNFIRTHKRDKSKIRKTSGLKFLEIN